MLDIYSRDALDLGRYYTDINGQIRAMVAPAQDYEQLAVVVQGGAEDHEHRMTDRVLRLVGFEADTRRALHDIGPELEHVLELCFYQVLASSGAAGHEMMARAVFGVEGASPRRATPLNTYYAHREHPARGPGNLAHLVPVLVDAYAHERTTLDPARWTDRLGLKLQRGQATPAERSWEEPATKECVEMERRALKAFHRIRRHLPAGVRRAGLLHLHAA